MIVVIDTNVLISAAFKDRDPETVVLFVLQHPQFQWVATREIIEEYLRVLRRPKFKFSEETIKTWEDTFASLIEIADIQERIDFPRDQKDAKFLECCLAAEADFFITGDRDFEEAYKIIDTTVMSVAQFKTTIIDVLETETADGNNLDQEQEQ